MGYKIAISSMALDGKLPPGDPRWAQLTRSFVNQDLELVDILDAIYTGHPYAPWFDGSRKIENFSQAGFIAVDLDTDDERSTVGAVECNSFYRMYGSIIYTTPSHMTPGYGPRCRVLFMLDEPIASAGGYRLAMSTVYNFFDGADQSCIDPSRFFYGNAALQQDPDNITCSDRVLPLAQLRIYARQMILQEKQQRQAEERRYQQEQRRQPQAGSRYVETALVSEMKAMEHTPQGGRNVQLNRSAFNLGTLVGAGALDEAIAVSQLTRAAKQTGLPESEIAKTLLSGLRAGKENPREILQ